MRVFAIAVFALFVLPVAAEARAGGPAPEPAWRYEVQVGAGARELTILATLAAGAPEELSVESGAEPFVRNVELEDYGHWQPLKPRGTSWFAPSCTQRGCRLRYRFLLAKAVDAMDSEVAEWAGPAIQSPPSTWLLHPLGAGAGARYRFHVRSPVGLRFVSGVHPGPGDDVYEADVSDLPDAPYSAFGPLTTVELESHGGKLQLAFVPGKRALTDADVQRWVTLAADAVGRYYGRFPVDRVLILVRPQPGDETNGRTLGNGGASIMLSVGESLTAAELPHDWVLTHELFHTAFPSVPRPQAWIEEGLATYLEPIARARAGQLSPEVVWGDMLHGLPNGLPQPGDRGLDHTQTWGRLYWGGALYCLLADVEIRERTHNTKSLDDALRGIVAAGGNINVRWSLDAALAAGDRALGISVLVPLRKQLGDTPATTDLRALSARLGVRLDGKTVHFDDSAELAAIRRAITRPTAP